MCCTFSLLVIEWKLCAHTASNVQTSKLAQCYTILACCWYQWCEYCRFVIFQLFFLKFDELFVQSSIYLHQFNCCFLSLYKIFHNCSFLMLKSTKEHYKCITGAVVYNMFTIVARRAPWKLSVHVYIHVSHSTFVLPMGIQKRSSFATHRCQLFLRRIV